VLPPWCARAPRAPIPSPACAHMGRNGVSGQLQGREGVLGGREGTPISENPPRFCPAPISASAAATLDKGERGVRAVEFPARSPFAPSPYIIFPTRSFLPTCVRAPQLTVMRRCCTSTQLLLNDAGAGCRTSQKEVRHQQSELRLRGGDAPIRPGPAPRGGRSPDWCAVVEWASAIRRGGLATQMLREARKGWCGGRGRTELQVHMDNARALRYYGGD